MGGKRERNKLQDRKRDLKILKRIEQLLDIKNVSKYRMCQDTGIAEGKMGTFKSGKSNLSKDEFFKICEYLKIDPSDLYYNRSYEKVVNKVYDDEIRELRTELALVKDRSAKYEAVKNIINEKNEGE